MAVSMEHHSDTLARTDGTALSDRKDCFKTLEEWLMTSGVTEALLSSQKYVKVKFNKQDEAKDIPEKEVLAWCSIEVTFQEQDDISICLKSWYLVSLDYTEAIIWLALAPYVSLLQLSCLPQFLFGALSNVKHLKLTGGTKPLADTCFDLDEEEDGANSPERISAKENGMFNHQEIQLLVDLLQSASCCIESLDCSLCTFGPGLLRQLFLGVSTNQTLQSLSFESCDATGDQALDTCLSDTQIANSALRMLTIQGCVFDEGSLEVFPAVLKTLGSLEAFSFTKSDGPPHLGRVMVEGLIGHPNLGSLDLSGTDIDDDGIQAIARLLSQDTGGINCFVLRELPQRINLTLLTDALSLNTTLSQLDLSLNRLEGSDDFGRALQMNHSLVELNLSRSSWEDDDDDSCDGDLTPGHSSFYAGLSRCKSLELLDLSYMHLTLGQMEDLATSIRTNSSIKRLLLNDLDRTSDSMVLAPLLRALGDNRTLLSLELGRNSLVDADVEILGQSLASNKILSSLTLSGCGLTDALGSKIAQYLPSLSLKDLDLSFNDIGRDGAGSILEVLRSKPVTIQSLCLHNSCWSVGGPTHFDCDGFEDINQHIQELLRSDIPHAPTK